MIFSFLFIPGACPENGILGGLRWDRTKPPQAIVLISITYFAKSIHFYALEPHFHAPKSPFKPLEISWGS
jgi:hypothetical protein